MLSIFDKNNLRIAVWITRVVDETSCIAHHCRIYHMIAILSKHVAAHCLAFVVLLALVCKNRSNYLARIFDDHFASVYVALAEETAAVNIRSINANCLFGKRTQVAESHRHRKIKTCAASVNTFILLLLLTITITSILLLTITTITNTMLCISQKDTSINKVELIFTSVICWP